MQVLADKAGPLGAKRSRSCHSASEDLGVIVVRLTRAFGIMGLV